MFELLVRVGDDVERVLFGQSHDVLEHLCKSVVLFYIHTYLK